MSIPVAVPLPHDARRVRFERPGRMRLRILAADAQARALRRT